tara:strand:- start:8456 stop:9778 length:1323 start_codon:yes stop_codon:yes gene_type:complete
VLLISSLLFYSWGEPFYIILLIFSSISDYFHGLWISKHLKNNKERIAKLFLSSSIIINLLLLATFKYADFIVLNFNSLFNLSIDLLELPLPIGLSFFTFQTISYSIDVFRRRINAQKNFINFAMYVTMFPQLIAGPIVRYSNISSEIENRNHNLKLFYSGIQLFVIGLSKKILLANFCGSFYSDIWITSSEFNLSVITGWLGIIFYSFQIYFDFSGYTDMAIGLSRMFGFTTYPENFNYPYISKSITDFWRRWHITLGSFFRDYVYIPLGGNKVSNIRWIINIFIVWALTGLWHGAAWNFVIWGIYFGLILLAEKFILKKFLNSNLNLAKHLYSLLLIVIGWAIFDANGFHDIVYRFKVLFGFTKLNLVNDYALYLIYNYLFFFIICIIASTPIISLINSKFKSLIYIEYLKIIIISSLFVLSIFIMISSSFNPFIYFRF